MAEKQPPTLGMAPIAHLINNGSATPLDPLLISLIKKEQQNM